MDRFSSHEDIQFDPVAFKSGQLFRELGRPQSSNPYTNRNHQRHQAWNAGWADEDQSIQSEQEANHESSR